MSFRPPAAGSLARRFAVATAALATVALLLTAAASWWLVGQQHAAALRVLSQREAEFHAATVGSTLHAISSRMSEVAGSSILATALVDSAGKETYLTPYMNSIKQINGVPIQMLFVDFEGREIASNGDADFQPEELDWLAKHLQSGMRAATIIEGADGPELLAVDLMIYSRTQTPEGALLYKVALRDLRPNEQVTLLWGGSQQENMNANAEASKPVDSPALFQHLDFRVLEPPQASPASRLTPQYATIFIIALALAGTVLVLGSRLALSLTRDLQKLEMFSRSVIKGGFHVERAKAGGSTEVASLARSINHMLDSLYKQHSELQGEREKFYQLANTIPQLAWIADAKGRVQWYNDRWYEYTGATPEESEYMGWQDTLEPSARPQVLERLKTGLEKGQPFQLSFELRGADGQYRPFFTSAAPLRDASGRITQWFGTNTDVSQLEQAERALRESDERLRAGLVAARMAVWDWDIERERVTFSSNTEEIFGYVPGSGNADWKAVHPEDAPALHEAAARAIAERSHFEQTVRMVRPDNGQTIWIETRGNVTCNAEGEACLIRGVSLDVTERKRAEEALRAANHRKDEFLAMLAHELRNPLAPISTAAEILRMAHSDPERVRLTSEIITRQVEHMTSLVDDLLDVSRVTRGLVTLDREPVDVAEIVAGAVEQVRPLINARHHRLKVDLGTEAARINGDRTRLVQIMTNLLNNAAKYTLDGGDIVLAVGVYPETVEFSIRDTGLGISPDLLPHVFELFTQAERSPDRSQGGLGLGLALVSSLVDLHGGSVHAYSQGSGRGSTFTVRLQRHIEDSDLPGIDRNRDAAAAPAEALRLMIIDDNADAAHSLAVLMEAEGHHVTIEYSARSALEHALTEAPQVFLLDIGLPDIDGYELARQLRMQPEMADAVLIAVTGYGREEDREQSHAAGFDHHLVKPANLHTLSAILAGVSRSGRAAPVVQGESA
jgi:PAS domain S-box-containing protein